MNNTKVNQTILKKVEGVKLHKEKLYEELVSLKLSKKYLWVLKDIYEQEYSKDIKSFSAFIKQIVVCFAEKEGAYRFGGEYEFEHAYHCFLGRQKKE